MAGAYSNDSVTLDLLDYSEDGFMPKLAHRKEDM